MLNPKLHLNEEIFLKDVELKSTRQGFGDALVEFGKDSRIIALTCDLTESLKLDKFAKAYPDRFIEVGIAEQNMAGIATGLALSGKIPFSCTHANFQPSQNWAQLRLSVCFSNANVKLIGSHSGLSNGPDGGAALSLEDIALVRVLPNMTVLNPIDYWQTQKAVEMAIKHVGPVYIRVSKEETPIITSADTPFEIGKAQVLVEGEALTLAATGPIVYEALQAAKELKAKHHIEVEVLAFPTIKPMDEETLINSVKKTGKIITIEEHQKYGGFGSAVAEILAENLPTPQKIMAVQDTFGESGSYQELKDKYGLSSQHIVIETLKFLEKVNSK